jgi:type VI protein secretion system component Hcp
MKNKTLLIFLLISSLSSFSQNLTLSPNTLTLPNIPNPSKISNPDKGAVVYNSTDNKVYYKDNVGWKNLSTTSIEAVNPNPISVYLYSESPQITPDEFQELGRRKEIRLESADFGSETRVSWDGPGAPTTGRAYFKEITIKLSANPSIPDFFQFLVTGAHLEKIELRYYITRGAMAPELLMTVKLGTVFITDLSNYLNISNGTLITDVSFECGAIYYDLKLGEDLSKSNKFGCSIMTRRNWDGEGGGSR